MGSALPNHSNAEYVLADYRVVAPKPKNMSFEDASAFPLVGITAWELFEQLRVDDDPGAILVINGAGGLGSVVTQLARHVFGLSTVIATASREARLVKWFYSRSLRSNHFVASTTRNLLGRRTSYLIGNHSSRRLMHSSWTCPSNM
jgi:NADPH:quinone reductase-like Zn-dependent oxidoreductase